MLFDMKLKYKTPVRNEIISFCFNKTDLIDSILLSRDEIEDLYREMKKYPNEFLDTFTLIENGGIERSIFNTDLYEVKSKQVVIKYKNINIAIDE